MPDVDGDRMRHPGGRYSHSHADRSAGREGYLHTRGLCELSSFQMIAERTPGAVSPIPPYVDRYVEHTYLRGETGDCGRVCM